MAAAMIRAVMLLTGCCVLAGCVKTRQVEGWYPSSLAALAANGKAAAGSFGLDDEATRDAAVATLREMYLAQWRVSHLSANRAGFRRSEEGWAALKIESTRAFAAFEAAAVLPPERLALGVQDPVIAEAFATAEATVNRFGGAPLPTGRIPMIRP